MKELLLETYTIILPVLLGYIVWLLKRQKRDRDANSKGTMLLLRVQLIEYHEEWTYHSLGGNGMVTHLLEEVEELPIKN